MRNRYCPAAAAAAVVLAVAGVASAQTSQFKISIGVRETGSTAAIGADGGGAGSIEWVDKDIQGLNADGQWHKFTFNFGTDPVSSFTGDGVLSTANMRGVLEHIRILNSGQTTNPITFWLDDLVNTVSGVDNVLGTWDSSQVAPGGYYLFRDPYWSGSTQTFVKPGATAKADATDFHSGDGSYKIDWSFVNPNPAGWVRMTTVGANPTIDFSNGNSVSF